MLKRRLIPLLIALVPPFVVLAVLLAQRSIPAAEASDLYRRYEHSEHISATFIKDFPIDDTLRLDVTLLQATDSAGWEALRRDFNVPTLPEHFLALIEDKDDNVMSYKASSEYRDFFEDMGIKKEYIIAISFVKHNIGVFHTITESQQKAVLQNNYKKSLKLKK